MKLLLSVAGWLAAILSSVAQPTKLAFEKDDAVYVANIDGSSARKIADGQSPELSRDGTKLVFNTVQLAGTPQDRNRRPNEWQH